MKSLFIPTIFFVSQMLTVNVADAQVATGGNYKLDQSVTAAGGGSSAGGQFIIVGTTGQSIAGQNAANAPFAVHAGFWSPIQFAPTAAGVSISGRVLTADGRGIRNVLVSLAEPDGATHTVMTGFFGTFRFAEISAGQIVIVSVRSKRFGFAEPTQVISAAQDLSEINFIALNNGLIENKIGGL